MIETTQRRAGAAGLAGVRAELRDVCVDGFGLPNGSCGACLLFNILHGESPVALLCEAARVVRPGGVIAVIHWRSDIATPRGPTLDIRPSPEHILAWVGHVPGLQPHGGTVLLPPWHFGLRIDRVP